MFHASAEYYDLIYAAFKDYAAEVAQISSLFRRLNPDCRTVLDVGCGTGEHALLLAARGFAVDGLDIEPAFVRIAAAKNPAGRFFVADMSDFHLPDRYDALLCLFSPIAYLRSLERVTRTLSCFREHLAPGGVALVEPWFRRGYSKPTRSSPTAVRRRVSECRGTRARKSTAHCRDCCSSTRSTTMVPFAASAKSTSSGCSRPRR